MAKASPADDGVASQAAIDWPAALAEHHRWLRSVVLARVGDPHVADDVLQEVALAAAKQGPELRDPAKVAPWLYRVAVRQVLLHRRTAGRRRGREDQLAQRAEAVGQPSPDPLHWLLSEERRALVRTALGQLKARDREILLLKYSEEWSYSQIAENLGMSESAVESRLHRARCKLRQALAKLDT